MEFLVYVVVLVLGLILVGMRWEYRFVDDQDEKFRDVLMLISWPLSIPALLLMWSLSLLPVLGSRLVMAYREIRYPPNSP